MNRSHEILQYLLHQEDFVTYEALAQTFQVSVASIRNDITQIEMILFPYGVELVRKRGTGVRLEGDIAARNRLQSMIAQGSRESVMNDSRLNELLYYLIERKEEYITIDKLSELLFVSRSTIQNDLKSLKNRLIQDGLVLEVKKNNGVRLKGKEKEVRSAYSKVFNSQWSKVSKSGGHQPIQNRILQLLHIDSKSIIRELHHLEQRCGYSFAQDSFEILVVHIAIAIKRIQEDEAVIWDGEMHIENYMQEFTAVQTMCDVLEKVYSLVFRESERYLLYLYVISARIAGFFDQQKEIIEQDRVYRIGEEIISLVENMKQMEIDESRYMMNLMMHLRPMVNRILNDIHLENPLIQEIKREYSDAYGIAWMANSIFDRYIGKRISEDEIGFLAIHIQIMTENQNEYLKVLIVCSSGIGVSQLLSSRLKSHFPKLSIIGIMSTNEFYHFQGEVQADLILSTFPLETKKPLLVISPLLTDSDLKAIDAYIDRKPSQEHTLSEDVDIRYYIHIQAQHQKEVISMVHEDLSVNGYVCANFQDSVIQREQLTSTAIGNRTALPHASFDSVNRSVIGIVTLEHTICWGDDDVDLIVFIALQKNDSIRLKKKLRALFYQLYSSELHEDIIATGDANAVQKALKL